MDDGAALALSTATDLAVAAGYAFVGARIRRRGGSPEARRARLDLAIAFWGIALTGLASALLNVVVLAGVRELRLLGVLSDLPLACFAVGAAGFAAYLVDLFLGAGRVRLLLFTGYAALGAWNVVASLLAAPTGFEIASWRPVVTYSDGRGLAAMATAALLAAPIALGSVAYLALWRQTVAARARFRLVLTSAALALWSASTVVIALGVSDAAQSGGRALVLSSAGVLLVAHAPPAVLERPLSRWARGDAARELALHERDARLSRRVRDLV